LALSAQLKARRIVLYNLKISDNDYWRKNGIRDLDHLTKALPHMAKSVPAKFVIPGWVTRKKIRANPDCGSCRGTGEQSVDHPEYPPGMFKMAKRCECVTESA
jgi:hypothetical protein